MAAYKFFNIGKANAEIDRQAAEIIQLQAEIKALKEAKPSDNSQALADALASNEQISTQLSTVQTDLDTAKQANGVAVKNAEKFQGEIGAVVTALKSACAALNLEVKEGETNVEMVSVLQGAVTATLAKLQVDASKVPAGVPTTGAGKAAKKLSLDEEIAARQAAQPTK